MSLRSASGSRCANRSFSVEGGAFPRAAEEKTRRSLAPLRLFTATYNDSHADDDGDETPPWWRWRRVAARLYVNSCVSRPRGRPLYARNKVPHSRPTAAGTSQPPHASSVFLLLPFAPLARYRCLNLPDLIVMPDSAGIAADRFSTDSLGLQSEDDRLAASFVLGQSYKKGKSK